MLKDCPLDQPAQHARGVNLDEMGPFKIEGEFVLLELLDPKRRKREGSKEGDAIELCLRFTI